MTQSISGLVSGLDVNSIVNQLVALERRSQDLVRSRASTASLALTSWGNVRSSLGSVRSAALALAKPTDWLPLRASSSSSAVSVSAGTGTVSGSITFRVDQLASAGSFRSGNTLTGTTALAAADAAIFVAAGGARIGFSAFASDDDLALGSHTIEVTQASAAAVKAGDAALGASTTITTGVNDTIDVTVNGAVNTLTIAAGTYDRSQLATAVQNAADAAGADITVSVDNADTLVLSTNREGSAATIQVTGGTALADLQLSADGAALTGTDGKVKIGSGPENTISSIDAGATTALNADAGTITATFSGGLRVGSLTGKNTSVGDGSLASVVNAINSARAGVTAAAVQVADGQYRLQITSNATGAASGPNIDQSELHAGVGGLTTLAAAADAKVTVGSGAGAYEVTSATNTVSNLLPGLSVTLKETTASDVTVTINRDGESLASKVQAMVDSLNALQGVVTNATKYDPTKNIASPLTGSSTIRRLVSSLSRSVTDAVGWTDFGSAGILGLSVDKNGKFTFDRAKFLAAFADDPDEVARVFNQGATATSSHVNFVSAGDRARAGTYDVEITTAAEQAGDVGLEGAWPIGSPPTVRVKIGDTEVSYAVKPTDTQQDVVDGLNEAFRGAELNLTASVSGAGVEIRSVAYGSSATFDVAWDGTTWGSHAGVDVEGTVNGIAGTGRGQYLTMATDAEGVGGMVLTITAAAAGALGTVTYEPGVAQRLATATLDAVDSVSGYVTSSENALKSRISYIDRQVESMEKRLELYERRIRMQFTRLESMLGTMQSQSNWLASQLAGLNAQLGQQ